MEDKIRKYVAYHFRNKRGKEKDDLIEEVTSNLLERFEELKDTYDDETRAYRETIARMGDFTDVDRDYNPAYTLTPELHDAGLLVGVVLGLFGLVAIFLHASLAFLLTVVSIVLFVSSAYYTYHKAQYEKTVNGDIDRFHLYLDKSFSHLKTAFIFWGITFTILFGQLIAGTIIFIEGINNPMFVISDLAAFIGLYFFSFSIATVVIGVFFHHIHAKIMTHYYSLSGKDHLDGTFKKGLGMLKWDGFFKTMTLRKALPFIAMGFLLVGLFTSIRLHGLNGYIEWPVIPMVFELIAPRYYFIGALLIVTKAALVAASIKVIRHPSSSHRWMHLSAFSIFAAYALTYGLVLQNTFYFPSFLNMLTLMAFYLVIALVLSILSRIKRGETKGRM